MEERRKHWNSAGTLEPKLGRPGQWPRPALADEVSRVMAVCEPGPLEERLRANGRTLGQDVRFLRSFHDALEQMREQFYEIVVVAKTDNGMLARDFVREAKKINDDSVIVIAAPNSEYDQLVEALVEGAYDFLPRDADDRQLRLMLGRAMDHSHLRRRSNRLERALNQQTSSLQQRLRELSMLNDMTQDIISVPDLDDILRRVLRRLLDVFGSECGSFLILDPETDELVVRAAAGPGSDELIGRARKLGEGVAGKVANARHPVLVTDVTKDSRFRSSALSDGGVRRYRSDSFIAMPLIFQGRLLGELNITGTGTGAPFTQDDLRLLATLGGHVASAVNGAIAAEELKKANESLRREMAEAQAHLRVANDKLYEVEHFAAEVVQRLPAAMVAFDPDLTVTFANETARQLFDLTRGDSLWLLRNSDNLAPLADAAEEVAKESRTRHLAVTAGSGSRLAVVVAPLPGADGGPSGGTIVASPTNCPLLKDLLDGEGDSR